MLEGPVPVSLFGKGSTGGIVEQDSKAPSLTPFNHERRWRSAATATRGG